MTDEHLAVLYRVEGKQDMTIDMVKEMRIHFEGRLDGHGKEIQSLKQTRAAAIASAGAVGGMFGFLGSTGIGKAIAAIIGSH